ncbi:MAG TPA: rhombotarget lipoprotein [Steroidobacteraceae bacterium]|nr:rhombotarget lipoprotein [Steroidobacteraceae bacterium]
MRRSIGLAVIVALIAGCSTLSWFGSDGGPRKGSSSSLVDYLYPQGEEPPPVDSVIPTLNLPLRVGLAFVPTNMQSGDPLSEARKVELLERTKAAFQGREYLREIVAIPETYMRSGRGFEGIDQVARLYKLDVIALVSHDQVATSSDTSSSFLYWTIVGAYVVEGTTNEVQTLVDTAVFDIPTRTLLFRAPGIDKITKDATLVGTPQQVRKTQDESFGRAMDEMTGNLQKELNVFRDRIKTEGTVRVVHAGSAGPGGSGSIDGLILCALLLLVAVGSRRSARSKA